MSSPRRNKPVVRRPNWQPPKPSRNTPPEIEPEVYVRPTVATINTAARAGRAGLHVGDRVLIGGNGTFHGEQAIILALKAGLVPCAQVRTDNGGERLARTIDLEPIAA